MITIKKIRIKNFRSLVDETIDFSDVNFFVGKNDSGKSNVLKALNLFFNGETDFGCAFDFSVDYSKFAKKVIKHAKEITISLDIVIPESFRENGIKTWTKIWRADGLHSDNIDKIFKAGSRGVTFLSRIRYLYIPAVKSNEYFKYLLSQVYLSMTQTADSTLKELNEEYSSQLQALTQSLSLQLQNILKLKSAIQMPENLNILFRDLTFSTSDKLVQGVDLNQRGDGIKARHIPSILLYMQRNTEKGRPKKSVIGSYIWGFEEPENGVEYLSCFEMAEELYSYKDECQLLITTHSPAFYLKSDSKNAKCFFVYKCEHGESKYQSNIDVNTINDNIGLLPLVAPYIKEEHDKYVEREKELQDQIKKINEKYQNSAQKIVIITEGKTDTKHIKFAFEQLNLDSELLKRIEYYDFTGITTLGDELNNLLEKLSKIPKTNTIIGIFDRDKHVAPNDRGKKYKALGQNVFRFNIPPLSNDERSESDKICIEHYYTNSEIKTQTDFGCLYMGKDFNDYGLSNDGKWCFQDYSKNRSIMPITIIDGANKHMQKLCDDSYIITKDDFADYVINHPNEFCFENFEKIFKVIEEIVTETNN